MEAIYDVECDRIDVAVRALVLLFRRGHWPELNTVGLDRARHSDHLDEALLLIGPLSYESAIFELLWHCPFLLHAALELLRCYWQATSVTRRYHYQRERARA